MICSYRKWWSLIFWCKTEMILSWRISWSQDNSSAPLWWSYVLHGVAVSHILLVVIYWGWLKSTRTQSDFFTMYWIKCFRAYLEAEAQIGHPWPITDNTVVLYNNNMCHVWLPRWYGLAFVTSWMQWDILLWYMTNGLANSDAGQILNLDILQ